MPLYFWPRMSHPGLPVSFCRLMGARACVESDCLKVNIHGVVVTTLVVFSRVMGVIND